MKHLHCFLLGLLAAGAVTAQAPIAIDLNSGAGLPADSSPSSLIARADGLVLFTACTPELGCELWRSNGTLAGTQLVLDIHPGPASSQPSRFGLDTPGSIVYFSADDGSRGSELWRSDGTAAGTRLIADLEPGVNGSDPRSVVGSTGIQVLFTAGTSASGREIYRSDGVTAALVVDLNAGVDSGVANSSGQHPDLTKIGTRVVFSGTNGISGDEPYLTDGTAAGTVRIKDVFIGGGGSAPTDFTAYSTGMVFVASNSGQGRELYRSDFTDVGTTRVSDITPGTGDGVFYVMGVSGTVALMAGTSGGANGVELFGYNGTTTALVRELNAGSADGLAEFRTVGLSTMAGGLLYFAGTSAAEGEELWRSDGTLNGTIPVAELLPGISGSFPRGLATLVQGATARVLFVPTFNESSVGPLFITDGTPGGLVNLDTFKNIDRGLEGAQIGSGPGAFLLLAALGSSPVGDAELWRSDGSAAATTLVADIATLTGSSSPSRVIAAGTRGFFTAFEANTGRELYVTRGSAATTTRVVDLQPGTQSAFGPDAVGYEQGSLIGVALGERLVFMAHSGGQGFEPHVSDGSAGGTLQLIDATPGIDSSNSRGIVAAGTRAFLALDTLAGSRLYATDGTPAGTSQVTLPCTFKSDAQLTAVGTRVYFRCTEAATGEELYRLESTTLAIQRVVDLTTGPESSALTLLGPAGRPARLAFLESNNGVRLLLSDGSVPGTIILNSDPGRDYKSRAPIIDGDGASYLRGRDAVGEKLFRINPALTALTTVLAYPNEPRPQQQFDDADAGSNCSLLLGDGAPLEGFELYRFNGITQSGALVSPSLQPGTRSSELSEISAFPGSDRYYANALAGSDGALGVELMRLDGNGPSLSPTVIDIAAGAASSAPRNFAMLGQQLTFSAHTAAGGRELYVLPPPDRIFGHGLNDGCGALQ